MVKRRSQRSESRLHKEIALLRKRLQKTQQEMADALGMSRASYIALEQGRRKIQVEELEVIADILGTDVQVLLGSSASEKKYQQMFFEFLRLGADSDGRIPKTKLAKLLYLADFAWYYENLESMSGMRYMKLQYGPVPKNYFMLVDEMASQGLITVKPKNESLLLSSTRSGEKEAADLLSAEEKRLIKKIARRWRGKSTRDIVSFTHNQLPYKTCYVGEVIPYELISQEDPDHVY